MDPLVVTRQELAPLLRVSLRTLDYLTARGVIPFIRLSERVIRFDVEAVKQALTDQATPARTIGRRRR